jgi:phosphate transport system protein
MTRHIERQIESLKERILRVGTMVEEAISKSITALINRDVPLAQRVMANDEEIDRMEVEVEEECLKILALYQPVAADLRFVVAVLKINNDLERMGDLAKNIAKRVAQLADAPKIDLPPEIRSMAIRPRRWSSSASTRWSGAIRPWPGRSARRTTSSTRAASGSSGG